MNSNVPVPNDRLLAMLLEAADEVLPLWFNVDSCLNSTCVAIDVLREWNVPARPVSVQFMAMNPQWAKHNRAPRDEAEAKDWATAGGWVIGVDTQDAARNSNLASAKKLGPAGWPGHLVFTARGYLVDLTVGQFARPQRGIHLPPVWAVPLTEGFLDGKAVLVAEHSDGSRCEYVARPEDKSYLAMPGFQRSPHNRNATRAMFTAIWHRAMHGKIG